MRSLPLARGRALVRCACAALLLGLAGCANTTTSSSTSVSGTTLAIYVSVPHGTVGRELQDVLSAEQLALRNAGDRVGKFTVKLVHAQGNELSDNARAAVADSNTIVYLGELQPGTSGQTIGITNAEDVLQVSPTDNAIELTRSTPAVPGSPDRYYESLSTYGRTFARVVPSDRLEAKALVGEIHALGVKSLYIMSDGSPYGIALRYAVDGNARGSGIAVASAPGSADGLLYAGSSATGATRAFNQAAANNSSVKLFGPSALARDALVAGLTAAARRELYVSSPGFTGSDLPPQGAQFVSAFKSAYGHAPAPTAIFGYEAMQAVLYALHRAGSSANNRGTVVHDFFAIGNRSSALGTYSINKKGEIVFANGAPFVISKVKGGKLVPVRALPEQG